MRRAAIVLILLVALVAVGCPVATAQNATPSPAPAGGVQGSSLSFAAVVLVVGILVAIALPTFLGARARARDKAAESTLRNGFVAGKVFFTDGDTYSGFTPKIARQIEPSLGWVAGGPPSGPNEVSIVLAKRWELLLVSRSEGGRFFCIGADETNTSSTTGYGEGPTFASVDTPAECSAPAWSS